MWVSLDVGPQFRHVQQDSIRVHTGAGVPTWGSVGGEGRGVRTGSGKSQRGRLSSRVERSGRQIGTDPYVVVGWG